MQNREKQIDYKGFANQMRQNAFRNAEGNIVCSEELWELIASTVEAKPADLAEEIFAEIEKVAEIGRIMNACAIVSLDELDEIKKKYIGKDTNVPTNTEDK